jgi:hypothetical protein
MTDDDESPVEVAILLEAGAIVIGKQQDEIKDLNEEVERLQSKIAELWSELGQVQGDYAECAERLLRTQTEGAKIGYALNCSVQLIEALLAWMPEGLVLSPEVGSAKGAWSKAMKDVLR